MSGSKSKREKIAKKRGDKSKSSARTGSVRLQKNAHISENSKKLRGICMNPRAAEALNPCQLGALCRRAIEGLKLKK